MALRTHTVNARGDVVATGLAGALGDDEGAPPPMPANVRTSVAKGESGEPASSSSPADEAELAQRKAAAAAKIAEASVVAAAMQHDTPDLRKFCLEIASRSGLGSNEDIIRAAKEFRDFVLKG